MNSKLMASTGYSKLKLYDIKGNFLRDLNFVNSIKIKKVKEVFYIEIVSELMDLDFLNLKHNTKRSDFDNDINREFDLGEITPKSYKLLIEVELQAEDGNKYTENIYTEECIFEDYKEITTEFNLAFDKVNEHRTVFKCLSKPKFKIY